MDASDKPLSSAAHQAGPADIRKFISDQLSVWSLASSNYRALKKVRIREMNIAGLGIRLQFNPERVRSTAADVSAGHVSERKCFLCHDNRPAVQSSLEFEGRKGRRYDILLNPYPIFPDHLVIVRTKHVPQSIWHRIVDMTDFARHFPLFTIFYNGPMCGASAPDHMHFQACPRKLMPLESDIDRLLSNPGGCSALEFLSSVQDASIYHYRKFTRGIFAIKARTSKSLAKMFYRLVDCMDIREGESEPRLNLLVWYDPPVSEKVAGISHGKFGEYRAVVIARGEHRPHHYFAEGAEHFMISPGCADMAGLLVLPSEEDFSRIDETVVSEILAEVSVDAEGEERIMSRLTRVQPTVEVGILSAEEIEFEIISDGAGRQKVSLQDGLISYGGALYDELYFDSKTMSTMFSEPTFILYDVRIGIDFHWDRRQDQKFAGALKFLVCDGLICAINVVGMEDYLLSVISSEMNHDAPLEFLKAHAVISRSWLMNKIAARSSVSAICTTSSDAACSLIDGDRAVGEDEPGSGGLVARCERGDNDISDREEHGGRSYRSDAGGVGETRRIVKWFDTQDHKYFDVCADDHCQRYQGLTLAIGENVRKAIDDTWGKVLRYGDLICDARFSKCCGGMTERFSTCWADIDPPYLAPVRDILHDGVSIGRCDSPASMTLPDLTKEENVRRWILEGVWTKGACLESAGVESFCNTSADLSHILNGYDLETKDYFRWEERYTRKELSRLITEESGQDIGMLVSLTPLRRGASGRISLLSIRGDKSSMIIGKELMIRKILSKSHLKSSAFVVDILPSGNEKGDDVFIIRGAGWGHGVGLCQIGAAVMAMKGYGYREILSHYYPGTDVSGHI